MTDCMMLDKNSIKAFGAFYPGDINVCVDEIHLSFGAFADDRAAALLSLRVVEGEFIIDWLYTAEDIRRRGIMSDLFSFTYRAIGFAGSMETIRVICPGEELLDFFIGLGFEPHFDSGYKTYVSKLADMKIPSLGKKLPPTNKLSDMGKNELNIINKNLMATGELAYGVKLPVIPSDYTDYSCAAISGDKLKVLLLFEQDQEDIIDISYVYKANGSEKLLFLMLLSVRDEIEKKASGDIMIRAAALNEASQRLFEGLFPNAEMKNVYTADRLVG
ncbi:MAG: hypothetical protein K6B14_06090 [Lachnospiraceae bacterium]|nr:hypothetical protein [Lachnospiraceae bacterium]